MKRNLGVLLSVLDCSTATMKGNLEFLSDHDWNTALRSDRSWAVPRLWTEPSSQGS